MISRRMCHKVFGVFNLVHDMALCVQEALLLQAYVEKFGIRETL